MSNFDAAAKNYDNTFVNSNIGQLQRKRVYKYLAPNINEGLKVLELNCGTGEDAIWMAKKGCDVLATDISKKMLDIVLEKSTQQNVNLKIRSENIENISSDRFSETYDLIFSNFGGLNCIDQESLEQLFIQANKLLTENGTMILVIMPKFCTMESLYFGLKLSFSRMFRRLTNKSVMANVDGEVVKTWYYSTGQIASSAAPLFKVTKKRPIGVFIPPSYMESFFQKNLILLHFLNKLEADFGRFSFLSDMADHYYIELKKLNDK